MKKLFYLFVLLMTFALPYSLKAQYCTPSILFGCNYGDYPDSFKTSGGATNIHYTPAGCPSSATYGYQYNTGATGDTCTGTLGQTISFTIYNQQSYTYQNQEGYAIFIDFNNNNSFFDAGEQVYGDIIAAGSSLTATFIIPIGATVGHTRLRLGCVNGSSGSGMPACDNTDLQGVFYDFDFVITGCSGTPKADSIITPALTSSVCYGNTVSLSAADSNHIGGVLLQWQQSGSASGPWTNVTGGTGANTLNYTTAPITATTYFRLKDSCVVSSLTNISNVYTVPMNSATSTISSQPVSVASCPNASVNFTVTATAGTAINYQWQVNSGSGFSNISTGPYTGATTNSLTVSGLTTALNNYMYRCILTGNCLVPVITNIDTLTVNPTIITLQPPANVSTCVGGNTTITTNAIGSGVIYKWQVNTGSGFNNITTGGVYSGADSSTLIITGATAGLNGYIYRCVVSALCGVLASNTVALAIGPPTTTAIATGPTSLCAGYTVTLKASIAGTAASYQWKQNGFNIPNATDSFYVVSTAGTYTAVVSNTQNCTNTTNSIVVTYYTPVNAAISIGGPLTFCQGGSVILSAANSSTPGLSYFWQLNGVYISSATSSSYTATSSGNYTLVEFDGTCNTSTAPVTITVNPIPSSTITYSGLPYFCNGDSIMLSAPTGTGYNYQWMKNGNNINGAVNSTYSVVTSGNYTVQVTSSAGCSSTSTAAASLTANPLPNATATAAGPTTICTGGSVVLNANPGANYTYQWQLNGVNILNATNASYTATAGGNYSVLVTDNTLNGCTGASAAVYVTQNPTPSAVATAAGPTVFCEGGSVVLNATAIAGQSYQWAKNGAGIPGATNPFYSATTTGSYTVIVTQNNCQATSASVDVHAIAMPVDTIIIYGPAIACAGSSILLQTLVEPGQTYQWLKDGFNILGATTFTYPATQSGHYSVAISDSGCTTYATPVYVTVANPPSPVITFTIDASGVTLHVPAIYVTYQWYYNNNFLGGANGPNLLATQLGAYTCIVTDVNGCTGQAQTFNVYQNTGVSTVNSSDNIKIYPNPATSVVNIETTLNVNVSISSLEGKVVLTQNNAHSLDISQLPNGIYTIKVYDKDNSLLKVDRLIKNNN